MHDNPWLSRLTIGWKLFLINILIWVGFAIIVGIVFWSFSNVRNLLTLHVSRNVDEVISNADIARGISKVFADANLLLGTYRWRDRYLKTKGEQLAEATTELGSKTANERLKPALQDFKERLEILLRGCQDVNTVLRQMKANQEKTYSLLDRLDDLIAEKIVGQVVEGQDASIMRQRSVMISGYRESFLTIERMTQQADHDHYFKDMQEGEHPIVNALDELELNLLTFTAPGLQANELMGEVIKGVRDHRRLMVNYHHEMADWAKLIGEFSKAKSHVLAILESVDHELSGATLRVQKDMDTTLSSTGAMVLFHSALVFIVVGFITAFFLYSSIRNPMRAIRKVIGQWGQGDLSARIDLGRLDEWHTIQQALNSMVSDLSDSYEELARRKNELEIAEEKYRSIFERSVQGIYQTTLDGKFISANPAMAKIFGYDSPDRLIEGVSDIAEQIYAHPERRDEFVNLIRSRREVKGFEIHLKSKDGQERWVSSHGKGIFNEHGDLIIIEGILEDITERKRLEEELRQAAKMQTIGELAGGVAHDFNNLLTAVMGYTDLLLQTCEDSTRRDKLSQIRQAAERASSLTQQLLAFGRKQVLEMKLVNLNEVIEGFEEMLRRLIGEDVEIVTELSPSIGVVKADPGQIEQILMNLAVNARDAMPRGGNLTIETFEVVVDESFAALHPDLSPGLHVCLTVSDTGEGIDPSIISRVFDPFFTTKEIGVGTGLGLSTVYGIVKQHRGHVTVYSELGHGTTFKVYLPQVEGTADHTFKAEAPHTGPQGTEVIMIVEDEEIVRNLTVEGLEMFGYTLLAAADPKEAIRISRDFAGPIHLLLTDVVLPYMDGRALYNELVSSRPEIRVLFVSGYTENFIVHHGVLDSEVDFLSKPFTVDGLASKVRKVLDGC